MGVCVLNVLKIWRRFVIKSIRAKCYPSFVESTIYSFFVVVVDTSTVLSWGTVNQYILFLLWREICK